MISKLILVHFSIHFVTTIMALVPRIMELNILAISLLSWFGINGHCTISVLF